MMSWLISGTAASKEASLNQSQAITFPFELIIIIIMSSW